MSAITTASTRPVTSPITRHATFLVLTVTSPSAILTIRSMLANVSRLTKNVSFRDDDAKFAFKGAKHTAISTPGDLLFHMRSERRDLCFEFERKLMDSFGDAVHLEDETTGFRYFDARDLLGFVDGTANPVSPDVPTSVLVATEDDNAHAQGGSYVVVQKHVNDLPGWKRIGTEQQEQIIGRTKPDNIELDDAEDGKQASHKILGTIEDQEGNEHDILRDNMPVGSPASGESGLTVLGRHGG
ncbi:hypothetical protein MYU51_018653 [Penicillium brevicompactum]